VPTVSISIGFPVELGLVASLAHPGGNMTGIAAEAALEINGKRLQILKEIVPGLTRVAVLRDFADRSPSFYGTGFEWTALDQAARELWLTLVPADIIPARARGAVLAGVDTACCALARPRRICGL
jgi:putative ABC transport system substrate-binding protein